jgi:hypothetical protein
MLITDSVATAPCTDCVQARKSGKDVGDLVNQVVQKEMELIEKH